ncbi:hypothetical protein Pint_30011 [Pistacia integerrima]|uniref:Uncharacterized protein n=1 Tax=Pistacia integerrima TaxID=434235 RepID=A0ACC0WZB4_9ROSI|nr:hypothetical protein Pint_30011 [Pistacia integerrima]
MAASISNATKFLWIFTFAIYSAIQDLFNLPTEIKATSEQPYREVFSPNPNRELLSVNEISKIMMNLFQTVVKMVFQTDKYYDSLVGSTRYVTACAKYKKPEKNEIYVGIGINTDKIFSTILHQKDVNGLEIQTKDGQHGAMEEFIPVAIGLQ